MNFNRAAGLALIAALIGIGLTALNRQIEEVAAKTGASAVAPSAAGAQAFCDLSSADLPALTTRALASGADGKPTAAALRWQALADRWARGTPVERLGALLVESTLAEAGAKTHARPRPWGAWVDLAAATRDPDVLADVLPRCARMPGDACSGLGFESWAEKDAGNGAPWLWQAERAAAAGDLAAAEAAAERSAQSARLDLRMAPLLRLLRDPLFEPRRGADAVGMMTVFAGRFAGTPMPATIFLRFCGDAMQEDDRLKARCERLATLAASGPEPIAMVMATRVGERLRWPEERLTPLRVERELIDLGNRSRSEIDWSSCDALARIRSELIDAGTRGERASLAAAGCAALKRGLAPELAADERLSRYCASLPPAR